MPSVIVISGANGAGKSTLAPYLLRDTFGILEYVNADTIAEGLAAFAPETVALEAGRVILKQLKTLAAQKKDFAFETTLSSRYYGKFLSELQADGSENVPEMIALGDKMQTEMLDKDLWKRIQSKN